MKKEHSFFISSYFAGQQWGSVVGWNPLSDDMNNAMAIAGTRRGHL